MPSDAALEALRRPANARPFVLGHRGARHAAPENTLRAFDLALTEGAEGVELDVRLDGSGRVVVFHDPTLVRLANGDPRSVLDVSATDLDAVRLQGERIPTLRDVLAWSREKRARVNVELKGDGGDPKALAHAVVEAIQEAGSAPELVFFSSFHVRLVRLTATLLREHVTCWLVHHGQRAFASALLVKTLGAAGVHPERTLVTPKRMSAWKRARVVVGTWTVNDGAEAVQLAGMGVDTLITDRPGAILKALDSG